MSATDVHDRILQALAVGDLEVSSPEASAHLAECAACRARWSGLSLAQTEVVAALEREATLHASDRGALTDVDRSALERLRTRVSAPGSGAGQGRPSSRPWRLVLAAASVLAVLGLTIVYLQRETTEHPLGTGDEIKIVRPEHEVEAVAPFEWTLSRPLAIDEWLILEVFEPGSRGEPAWKEFKTSERLHSTSWTPMLKGEETWPRHGRWRVSRWSTKVDKPTVSAWVEYSLR